MRSIKKKNDSEAVVNETLNNKLIELLKGVENYKISDAVASNNWDYIMFNELYTRDAFPTYYSSLNPLIEIVKGELADDANPKYISKNRER